MPGRRVAFAMLAAGLALSGCGGSDVAVTEAAADAQSAQPPAAPADGTAPQRCAGAHGVLYSHYIGGTAAVPRRTKRRRPPSASGSRTRSTALHGKALRLTVEPHPHNPRHVVVVAHGAGGPSSFTVSKDDGGTARITEEQLCRPPLPAGVSRSTSTELPGPMRGDPRTCAGRVSTVRNEPEGPGARTPADAARARIRKPDHPLHGKRFYVARVPKPWGERAVVVVGSAQGPSRFHVRRGDIGRWIVDSEDICHPTRA